MLMIFWVALQVDLWDINKMSKVRSFAGHSKHVTALSWNSHLLSSAGSEGMVLNRDMRVPEDSVAAMKGHRSTISGLKVSFPLPCMQDNQRFLQPTACPGQLVHSRVRTWPDGTTCTVAMCCSGLMMIDSWHQEAMTILCVYGVLA